MKILHLLTGGKVGGIETLCREIGLNSIHENAFCFMTFGGEVYEQMDKLNIKTYPFFMISEKKLSLKKLKQLVKTASEYDMLIVHNADPFLEIYYVLCKLLSRKCGIRYVHSCFGDESQFSNNKVKNYIERKIRQISLDVSDKIIAVSEAGIDSCKSYYRIKDDNVKLIYNGISTKYLYNKQLKEHVEKAVSILYIGRLEKIKGVDILLDAISSLRDKYKIRLSIVGDGTCRMELEEFVRNKGLSNIVSFFGSQTDIIPYLKDNEIFVYPSICQEVFGISLVEAMSHGLVCVANRVGGIPEIIDDGENGYLAEDCGKNSLVNGLMRAIDVVTGDAESYKMIQENAILTAEKYSIENTCRLFDSEVKELYEKS